MSIRVLVNGANGKMGQVTVPAVIKDPGLTLVGSAGRQHDLASEIKKTEADVVIDLTNAESVFKNTLTIIECGARPVIGTSGLKQDDVKNLKQRCETLKIGGIIAPNFSLGAVLLMKQAAQIAPYFPNIEIIEMHHHEKLDSPSGTAVRAAEMIAEARTETPYQLKNSRETVPGARGASYQNIPIHAVRLPGLMAYLQILFGGLGETITLSHNTIDRQCFMPGIILSCKKVMELDHLVYGLEHLL